MKARPESTLSNWIANAVYVERGKRLSYSGRLWMPALFDTNARQRIWKMSRQVGKTTGGVAECVARACLIDGYRILYVCPEQDQAKKYSRDKLEPLIEESPIIRSQKGELNNVFEKGFKKKGKIYLKYVKHNPDSCRGLTVDKVHYDEIQDQDLEYTEPVIRECMFNSSEKRSLYSGTPKSLVNPVERKWQMSDQREWLVRCDHHTPGKWIRIGLRNIGKHGPTCHHCGNLLDVDKGQWVIHNEAGKLAGFHVSQLHCKISHNSAADWEEILDKFENSDRHMFLNEVMGESADSAEVPLSESDIVAICDPKTKMSINPTPKMMNNYNFCGIDWGHGSFTTALCIGQMDQKSGGFRVVYMRVFEGRDCQPKYCVPEIVKAITNYHVLRVHCDYGGGFGLNEALNDALSEIGKDKLVTSNFWSNSATAADQQWTDKHEIPRVTLNKNNAFTYLIRKIYNHKLILPRWEDTSQLSNHFTNVRKEVNPKDGTFRYERSGVDDMFNAVAYAEIIARMYFASGQN